MYEQTAIHRMIPELAKSPPATGDALKTGGGPARPADHAGSTCGAWSSSWWSAATSNQASSNHVQAGVVGHGVMRLVAVPRREVRHSPKSGF
jgi:hypothetical protein